MSRWFVLMLAFSAGVGCLRDRRAEDPLRAPTARGSEPTRRTPTAPASRPSSPDDLRIAPPRMEEPAKVDDRKERREERKERREERREERRDGHEKPKLPSPKAESVPPLPKLPNASTTNSDLIAARKIYDIAAAQWEKLTDFEATLTRREVIGKTEQPTETVLFQYRKKPFSIYMRNLGDVGRGREVLYVDGQHEGKMHIVIGEGDGGLLMKPGNKMALPPNSPLVTGKSRHRITEAGFGDSLAKFGKLIALAENGSRVNAVKSLGTVQRKEYPHPLEGLELTLAPGDEPSLPRGGKKVVYFDLKEDSPAYGFPVLLITLDENGREVEYYFFDKIRNPAGLTDADFHPDRLQARKR